MASLQRMCNENGHVQLSLNMDQNIFCSLSIYHIHPCCIELQGKGWLPKLGDSLRRVFSTRPSHCQGFSAPHLVRSSWDQWRSRRGNIYLPHCPCFHRSERHVHHVYGWCIFIGAHVHQQNDIARSCESQFKLVLECMVHSTTRFCLIWLGFKLARYESSRDTRTWPSLNIHLDLRALRKPPMSNLLLLPCSENLMVHSYLVNHGSAALWCCHTTEVVWPLGPSQSMSQRIWRCPLKLLRAPGQNSPETVGGYNKTKSAIMITRLCETSIAYQLDPRLWTSCTVFHEHRRV